jgi:predicted HicB family RNase H-like nuclease
MIKPMMYKGYTAKFEYDDECETFLGEVIDLNDIVTFQGNSVEELRLAFHESVDAYLEYCEETGSSPAKPFSGKFSLRISKELHHATTVQASIHGMSLNGFVEKILIENTASVKRR